MCRQCSAGRTKGSEFTILQGMTARRKGEFGYAVAVVCDQCGPTHVSQDGTCVGHCRYELMHSARVKELRYARAMARRRWWRPSAAAIMEGRG